jgi:hypothetical protein
LPPSFCQGPLSQTLAAPVHSVPNKIYSGLVDPDPSRKKRNFVECFLSTAVGIFLVPEMLSWWYFNKHLTFLTLFIVVFDLFYWYPNPDYSDPNRKKQKETS